MFPNNNHEIWDHWPLPWLEGNVRGADHMSPGLVWVLGNHGDSCHLESEQSPWMSLFARLGISFSSRANMWKSNARPEKKLFWGCVPWLGPKEVFILPAFNRPLRAGLETDEAEGIARGLHEQQHELLRLVRGTDGWEPSKELGLFCGYPFWDWCKGNQTEKQTRKNTHTHNWACQWLK